jgi:photosystem II stability/assembly factor-like uncharacterized protein
MRIPAVLATIAGLFLAACAALTAPTPILFEAAPPPATQAAPTEPPDETEFIAPTPTPTITPTITPTYLPSPTPLPAELPDAITLPDPEEPETLMLPAGTALLGEDAPRVGASLIALAPGYPADPTIVALMRSRELLLSTDDGESWTLFEDNFPLPAEIRPEIERFYFLPTGELIAIGGNFIFRSQDRGTTWVNMGIAGEPTDLTYANGAHFVVTSGYVWRSADGGVTWEEVLPAIEGCPTAIAFSLRDGHGVASRCGNLAHSADGGLTWEETPNETPNVWLNNAIARLFLAPYYPDDPRIIGLGSANELNLTTDGGRTWTSLSETWETPVLAFRALTMSPDFSADSSLMAAGIATVYDTSGTFWRLDDGGAARLPVATFPGRDCVADITYAPNAPSTVFASGCQGIFRSDDAGATWRLVHPGAGSLDEGSFAAARSRDGADVVAEAITLDDSATYRRVMVTTGGGWQLRVTVAGSGWPLRLWPSPRFLEDGTLISLDTDAGGSLHVGSWRPGLTSWLDHSAPDTSAIPPGAPDLLDNYEIYFDLNYAVNGVVRLRHPAYRVTYVSEDGGLSWERTDPMVANECYQQPRGGFDDLWEDNDAVRLRLGCPAADEVVGPAAIVQPFEGGLFLRVTEPTEAGDAIDWRFALISVEGVNYWATLAQPGSVEGIPEPPAGLQPPDDEFAQAWLTQEYSDGAEGWQPIQETVGWATAAAEPIDVIFQSFEYGWMIWRADTARIYVIYRLPGADLPLWEVYQSDTTEPW